MTQATAASTSWHPLTRVVFRFCVVYFGLFCLLFTQIPYALLGVAGRVIGGQAVLAAMSLLNPVTSWVGRSLFGVDAVLHEDSGSGDQAAIWVFTFCILVVAMMATALWTMLDRHVSSYPRLLAWFTLFLRICLGGQMLFYGFAKLIPTQMPGPTLAQLLQPYGTLSPASVLWLQVGSSYPYEMALGAVEVIAGLLLFVPRTAVLGTVLSLAGMAQVFLMNMAFDVPVKLLSFHLLLLSLVLLAPYLKRLVNVFVRQRSCDPLTQPSLFVDRRRNRLAVWLQVALGVWVALGGVYEGWVTWHEYGGGAPKSQLYGMWSVQGFFVDGVFVPPYATDRNRWQAIVFDRPGMATYQHMNGNLTAVLAEFRGGHLLLTNASDDTDGKVGRQPPFADLTYSQPNVDALMLGGRMYEQPVTIMLKRMDPNSFPLRNRGFHWVQEYPFFR
ncbi:DoxX family protein [Mycobacteroides saopaulense]|uniref:DoxX family protein n=1 Tax=Mycobacteroides saopaulense TaxID=1578165 RepID=A0A1S4VA56_9MYCO|nr:DoxX family protein [Mycobacteroides saopaulense]ALR10619.1 DoxX family protein [Mycobacteroides saopaulense]ORB53431.1 DoxX family protein [Mycobacteroides saopaulense]